MRSNPAPLTLKSLKLFTISPNKTSNVTITPFIVTISAISIGESVDDDEPFVRNGLVEAETGQRLLFLPSSGVRPNDKLSFIMVQQDNSILLQTTL